MKTNKILVISDVPPCSNQSQGLYVRTEIEALLDAEQEVHVFVPYSPELKVDLDKEIVTKTFFNSCDRPLEEFSIKGAYKKYKKDIRYINKKITKYIKDNQINKVIISTQGKCTLDIANYIHKKIGLDYIIQILDPIEWWIKERKFSKKLGKTTLKLFNKVLNNSEAIITISETMAAEYQNSLRNKKILTLYPSATKINCEKVSDDKKFKIGFSGQPYNKREFDILLKKLDKLNWQIDNKTVFLDFFGNWKDYYSSENFTKKYPNIIDNGYLNQSELLYRLSQCDILFCPYFFSADPIYKLVSELSFPSKLAAYFATKVPILIYAPEYSNPARFAKKHDCCYIDTSINGDSIVQILKTVNSVNKPKLIETKTFETYFDKVNNKKKFLKFLEIPTDALNKKRFLEINNIDLMGRRFNGYDLTEYINEKGEHKCSQLVTYKSSDNNDVYKLYNDFEQNAEEGKLLSNEYNILKVHNVLSYTSNVLKDNELFHKADLVHYHLIHNTKFSLCDLDELFTQKPTVLTIHDPWIFTGKCVYTQGCEKWKNGCKKCEHLDSLFSLEEDNANALFKLKEKQYALWNIDIIVTTEYMRKMLEESPITNFKYVHVVPFGIDLNKFKNNHNKKKYKKHFGIDEGDIVIFFRSQMAMKGTEYIYEALDKLNPTENITLLTCNEIGNLKGLEKKYNIIELGDIEDDEMVKAYNATDIFLMPSKGESFGLMAAEAMACELPIIIFDNSALPYVTFAPLCGVLAKDRDANDLRIKIEWLLSDEKERIKRGLLGRKLAEENYSLNKYNEAILKVYESAYERQKNKPIVYQKTISIDYANKNIQLLLPKLRKVFKNVYSEPLPDFLLSKEAISLSGKVDYSDDNVIQLIKNFNLYLYEKNIKYQNYYEVDKNSNKEILPTLYRIKITLYPVLKKSGPIFFLTRKSYMLARRIYCYFKYEKNISKKFLEEKYYEQAAEIEYLKQKLQELENNKKS